MQKIILSGCNGHMGRVLTQMCQADPELEIAAGFDILGQPGGGFPVFSNPALCDVPADVVIDFSNPAALGPLLEFCTGRGVPLVLATTGFDQAQLAQIEEAARTIPLFRSANMSLGVNVLLDLVRRAAAALGGDYDVEIVERHHRRKLDAPSGTALMLADAAASALPGESQVVYDRHAVRRARQPQEIGVSSVRGGTIVGDHTVIIACWDEVIEHILHAASPENFASGAITEAKFLAQVKRPGMYDMSHLLAAGRGGPL